MKAKILIVTVSLVVLAGGGYFILNNRTTSVRKAGTPPPNVTIFYTCDTRGHIDPCGCSAGMAGGMARRKSFILEHRAPTHLVVDAGDVTAGKRSWELLEVEYILKGYQQIGYHAVNVGHREASISQKKLLEIKAKYSRFVSANLLDAQTGKPVFDPYTIVTMPGHFAVGIVGIMDDTLPPAEIGEGLKIAPPHEALTKVLPELKAKTDMIVLLAFAEEEKMKALAERFYEVAVIVGGKVRQPSGTPQTVNKTVIAYITDKGKAVGRLDLAFGPAGRSVQKNDIVMLKENYKDDADIAKLIDEYKIKLKEMDFQPHKDDEEGLSSISLPRSKDANKYVGAGRCTSCHTQAVETWERSKHAHAFHTLEEKKYDTNPRCLQCHTVGYMSTDGYINQRMTPQLKNVSCESCHGRGDYHVRMREGDAKITEKQAAFKKVNCKACHDPDNSPNFDYNKYWEKIKHGKE